MGKITLLNEEFQRIARRDKKFFLNEQYKEIKENNRMGKTRDLFKKTGDTQGNISCKDGHNKGQKCYGHNRSIRYSERYGNTIPPDQPLEKRWTGRNTRLYKY